MSNGPVSNGVTYSSPAASGTLGDRAGHIQTTIDGLLDGLRGAFTDPPDTGAGQVLQYGMHSQVVDGTMLQQIPYHQRVNMGGASVPMIGHSSSMPMSVPTQGSVHPKFCDKCGAICRDASKFCAECGSKLFDAAPAPSDREDTDKSFSARNGMVLGLGSWGDAYRQASGTRRDALRMLAMTGIVTERELGDDNTKVAQDHIEECVCIATEMLFKWPPSMGTPPVHQALPFFEERLAQRHMMRRPDYGTCGLYTSSGHFN